MRTITFLSGLALLPLFVHSQSSDLSADGFYFGVNLPYMTNEGDFNGNTFLYTNQEVFLVPQVEGGIGFGFRLGWRDHRSALEVGYNRTNHEVSFINATGTASLVAWSIDWKLFFRDKKAVQPYIQLGWVPGVTLNVNDASAAVSSDSVVRDANFRGNISTTQFGTGIAYVINSRIFIDAGFTYRLGKYTGVAGGKDLVGARIENPLKGGGFNFLAGISFVFSQTNTGGE